jgi:hypothetical protein
MRTKVSVRSYYRDDLHMLKSQDRYNVHRADGRARTEASYKDMWAVKTPAGWIGEFGFVERQVEAWAFVHEPTPLEIRDLTDLPYKVYSFRRYYNAPDHMCLVRDQETDEKYPLPQPPE